MQTSQSIKPLNFLEIRSLVIGIVAGCLITLILLYLFVGNLAQFTSYLSLSNLVQNPQMYIGKVVTVSGHITECLSCNYSNYTGYGGYVVDYQGYNICFENIPRYTDRTFYSASNYSVSGIFVNESSYYFINASSIIRLN